MVAPRARLPAPHGERQPPPLHRPTPDGKQPVTQRLKRFDTIVDKLLREPTMKLSQMADVGGVRAQFPNQEAVYRAARKLRKNWEITKLDTRLALEG